MDNYLLLCVIQILNYSNIILCCVGGCQCLHQSLGVGVASVSLATKKSKSYFFGWMFLAFLKIYACFSRMIKMQFFFGGKTAPKAPKFSCFGALYLTFRFSYLTFVLIDIV